MVSSESDSDSGLPDPDNSNNSELTISNDEIILFTDEDDELDDQELIQFDQYQPLPMEESQDSVEESSEDETVNENIFNAPNPNIPPIVPVEDSLLREVWTSAPSTNIEMDSQKVDEVKQVMAHITLPASSIPEWAAKIPEENWKQELMQRIEHIKKFD